MQENWKKSENSQTVLPEPEAFREWLRTALTSLGLKPTSYGPSIGLGKNTLGHFLQGESRDLRLGTASALAKDLRERAEEKEISLGEIQGVPHE